MKNFKGFAFGLVLGVALAISSIGFAQTATQTEPKATDSCCATACCSKHDSCSMKDHANKEHAHKDHAQTHAAMAGHGCCCCSGDSCELRMTQEMKDKPKG